MIRIMKQMPLQPGDIWFVVSRQWYQAWEFASAGIPNKKFADITEATLGPVDNSDLVHLGTHEMLLGLVEGYQFELVPEEGWKKLTEWYGEPSIVLRRSVVSYPTASGLPETRVEVYHPHFFVFQLVPESSTPIPHAKIDITSNASLSALGETVASALGVQSSSRYRLWNMPPITSKTGIPISQVERGTLLLVPSDDSILVTEFGRMGRVFAMEVCGEDGQWLLDAELVAAPEDPLKLVDFGSLGEQLDSGGPFPGRTVGPPVPRGSMGLQNLGHTCFMNAGLQCLLHIPELERYFLKNLHLHELNPNNPVSTDGKMAVAFNTVVHQAYPPEAKPNLEFDGPRRIGSSSAYTARYFHDTLCLYAPIFAGYEENDSQELVGMVLDSLHEDLNRVLKKPYVERPEWPDEDLGEKTAETEARIARETWEGHVRRNDSIIADLFHGMYKSTLSCLSCGKISVTFEPFVSLPLPLPDTLAPWSHDIYYVPWDIKEKPFSVRLELPKGSSVADLTEKLAICQKVKQSNLLVTEVWKHIFFKFFNDDADITDASANDVLVVYELPVPAPSFSCSPTQLNGSAAESPLVLPAIHTSSGSPFGLPFPVVVTRSQAKSHSELHRVVAERSIRWTKNQNWDITALSKVLDLKVFSSGSEGPETGFRLGSSVGKIQNLVDHDHTPSGAPLLKSNEALICEWHPKLKQQYFSTDDWLVKVQESRPAPLSSSNVSPKKENVNIEHCLDELTKTERLGSRDSWYCSRCKTHRAATKQLQLWSTPNILILQIKRFAKRDKIDELVEFPISGLDLWGRVGEKGPKENYIYDLFAVDQHQGGNLSTGAYSSYAKNESDGGWYHFFDANVSRATPEEAINSGAYLLFYRRQTASVESVINKAKSSIKKPMLL
ncbi:ubiquitin carboxyl-terminal hydrolase [Ceratobasidium sp. AG-Ba]|nr:ubiquitin carboxyl-terminal hydrolase [Ceratobasidium sp. AG-Ba]QRW04681.1 ubiquitin carboxyl-terminal hydrolase [Ceratobasidium sp. AG-Ba]